MIFGLRHLGTVFTRRTMRKTGLSNRCHAARCGAQGVGSPGHVALKILAAIENEPDNFTEDQNITTDSFRPHQQSVRKHLLGRLDFATMQKLCSVPFDAKAEAARRYSPAQCTGVKIRIQAGAPRQDRISTSYVERGNLTVRHFNKRFARLGLGYSPKLCNHRYAISLFV
jgi:IS1 family transposase